MIVNPDKFQAIILGKKKSGLTNIQLQGQIQDLSVSGVKYCRPPWLGMKKIFPFKSPKTFENHINFMET